MAKIKVCTVLTYEIIYAGLQCARLECFSLIFSFVVFSLAAEQELRIQFKLNTALLSYCPSVRLSVTGVTSHISHIYKGINAMLIIRGPINPNIF